MWRVCLAEHCLRKSAGVLHELPTGEVSIFERDPFGKVHTKAPLDRITSGVFELPRYPVTGWISERWFPPSTWGTPEQWKSHRADDGGRILASEFPSQGDYFLVGSFGERIPEMGDIENAIQMWEQGHRNRPTNMLAEYHRLLRLEEDQRLARQLKLERDLEYMRKNELVPILKSGSLEAQRFRNQLSEAVGDRSHLGAVHDA